MTDLRLSLVLGTRGGPEVARAMERVHRSVTDMSTGAQRSAQKLDAVKQGLERATRAAAELERQGRRNSAEFREQERAAQGYRRALAQMERDIARVTRAESARQHVYRAARAVSAAAVSTTAGVAAGAAVVAPSLSRAMGYEQRLALMANTAFAERDVAGRRAGMADLDRAITAAVRFGGGKREQGAETLDTLIASGAMSVTDAMQLLPQLQRKATGTGADPAELAQIAIRGMQTFGIKPDQISQALDMAIVAGQAGGFELKDMARWLPKQMAAGRMSGLSGIEGFRKILAANQASVITAGTKDEAGNNLTNLLLKMNSADTRKDFARLGIDLTATLAAARGKGADSLEAFVALVNRVVSRDKQFGALQKKLAKAGTEDERRAVMESQADILQGASIGLMVQDREALLALVAVMNNPSYMKSVVERSKASTGAGDTAYGVVEGTAGYQAERVANERAIGEQQLFGQWSEQISGLMRSLADYAAQYPDLTGSLTLATGALTGLAAAAAGSKLLALLAPAAGAAAGAAGTAGAAIAAGEAVAAGSGAAGVAAGAAGGSVAPALGAAVLPALLTAGLVQATEGATAANPLSALYAPEDEQGRDPWRQRQDWMQANYSWTERFKQDTFGPFGYQARPEAGSVAERSGMHGTPDEIYDALTRRGTLGSGIVLDSGMAERGLAPAAGAAIGSGLAPAASDTGAAALESATQALTAAVAEIRNPAVTINAPGTFSVVVNAQTNADPAAIGAAVRAELDRAQRDQAARLRGALNDSATAGP